MKTMHPAQAWNSDEYKMRIEALPKDVMEVYAIKAFIPRHNEWRWLQAKMSMFGIQVMFAPHFCLGTVFGLIEEAAYFQHACSKEAPDGTPLEFHIVKLTIGTDTASIEKIDEDFSAYLIEFVEPEEEEDEEEEVEPIEMPDEMKKLFDISKGFGNPSLN